jgi:hypothetical protein
MSEAPALKTDQEREPEAPDGSPDASPETSSETSGETSGDAEPTSGEESYEQPAYDETGHAPAFKEENNDDESNEEPAEETEQNRAAEPAEPAEPAEAVEQQSTPRPTSYSNSGTERYDRVGGWLLLLCVLLTILGPLATAYSLVAGYAQLQGLFEETPGLSTFYNMNFVLNIGLGLFSLWAGFSLWTKMAGAVERAKKYLLARVAYTVILYFLPAMSGLPEEMSTGIQNEILAASTFSFIYIAIWYLYLTKSKRVRETYQNW